MEAIDERSDAAKVERLQHFLDQVATRLENNGKISASQIRWGTAAAINNSTHKPNRFLETKRIADRAFPPPKKKKTRRNRS